ncbi:MAG TPA: hypothetical protein VKU41_25870, partial [Polyangiaceae bacterium]|nr:hypothetical protein [Polyangiaceae bacterium]
LSEDATAQTRGASLDLFAFAGRSRALRHAREAVDAFRDPLPEVGPAAGPLARPRLERDLLLRVIDEELARAADEAALGDASGDLVRAVVATWTPPKEPQDWRDRDAWASRHLLEIAASLHGGARTGPTDLDISLYPLERLLAPLVFPKSSAAIASLRVALDADTRPNPPLATPERVARLVHVHLGLAVDAPSLKNRLESTEARLRVAATSALEGAGDARRAVESRARDLLFVEGRCPAVPGTRVRNMAPPPERALICRVIAALADESSRSAALVALHDDVILALAAVTTSPPPRTMLLSHPEDDVVDESRRAARERPSVALGVALAADLLVAGDTLADRVLAWRDFGDAPLDVVADDLAR